VLRVGQEVDVYVLGINAQEKKIALSIKRTQAEPWSRVAAAYEVGQLVRGTVTQLANFGAFARIEDGIEGLIHVSELVDDRVSHPKQVVSEGDDLLLRIIRIDPQRRRMGLSLRRALDTPDAELEGVFGPDALRERDELIERIRVRLEAEGIELGDAFSGEASESSDEEPSEAADVDSSPVLATISEVATDPGVEEQETAAVAPATTPRPAAQPKPRKEPGRPAVDLPEDLDGELSAMAMAFAMAGAPADLVAEASGEADADASSEGEG
jgi:predicted RNA-binding protein with RPS1 domain